MGSPKKHRKKYTSPGHPWESERLEEETKLKKGFGMSNKKELWKMNSFLRKIATQAKILVTREGDQAEKEKLLLVSRVKKLGLLPADASLGDILSISLEDVLERRLQTQVYKKNLANSVKQARQFITHEHITVAGKLITSPSYFVKVSEESQIDFHEKSSLKNPEHPERVPTQKPVEKTKKEDKKEAAKV